MDEQQQDDVDISSLPELATMVGIPGPMYGSEMGGQPCSHVGIAIALIVFGG